MKFSRAHSRRYSSRNRWSSSRLDLARSQTALLRAGAGHDLRIMFPMIATLDEVVRAKSLLAAERGNRHVAHLNDTYHPAVLKEIRQVVTAALQADIGVGICGEMAGDLQDVPILLGLGVDELSMASRQIPIIKQVVRN